MSLINEWKNFFDQVYIINLPYRSDRRVETIAELKSVGYEESEFIFFEASRPNDAGDFPSIGSRGCFDSHLRVMKDALQHGYSKILILEDDVCISKKWMNESLDYIASLNSCSWDIAYFGYEIFDDLPTNDSNKFTQWDKKVQTLHFYALNASVLTRVVEFLELILTREAGDPLGGPMHVDGAISTFREQNPDIITLLAIPCLATQRASKTDIGSHKFFDKVFFLKDLVAFARKIKNVFTSIRKYK